ncbi:hypothetical protein NON20_18725 [Synechocystis sp. B12]|nr:hypothetical protein NON20_18725 [Synechocystis sp. B12]
MSTQQQARALMMRHHQFIKNRQQSMLSRAAAEIGVEAEKDFGPLCRANPNPVSAQPMTAVMLP